MCGRGEVDYTAAKIVNAFRQAFGAELDVQLDLSVPRRNVVPSAKVPVLQRVDGRFVLADQRWGAGMYNGEPIVLTRSERLLNGQYERLARGLVAFTKFYEWQGEKPNKIPYAVRDKEGAVLMLAALCMREVTANGEVREGCRVVTQPALGPLTAIHERMPVLVSPDHLARWFDAASTRSAMAAVLPDQFRISAALEVYVEDPLVAAGLKASAPARTRRNPSTPGSQGTLF
ncbi:SOS response-associated peptidase [Pendulispora brunnea]|uniref:Abasic site processing protein n=1 Tax=Pendulispora brunnea TaxID=2905690 RepID=A0ABZ2KJZ5_9BACT